MEIIAEHEIAINYSFSILQAVGEVLVVSDIYLCYAMHTTCRTPIVMVILVMVTRQHRSQQNITDILSIHGRLYLHVKFACGLNFAYTLTLIQK